mmetsp:Transcript_83260/g.220611  ORF Transcript_83260/g.220611 Transcript_83260/m.220611 type:complete len:247 (-) Transcript_83260:15-755(-)
MPRCSALDMGIARPGTPWRGTRPRCRSAPAAAIGQGQSARYSGRARPKCSSSRCSVACWVSTTSTSGCRSSGSPSCSPSEGVASGGWWTSFARARGLSTRRSTGWRPTFRTPSSCWSPSPSSCYSASRGRRPRASARARGSAARPRGRARRDERRSVPKGILRSARPSTSRVTGRPWPLPTGGGARPPDLPQDVPPRATSSSRRPREGPAPGDRRRGMRLALSPPPLAPRQASALLRSGPPTWGPR